MPSPVSAFEPGAWSSADILHWGYAHLPSSLFMQSRHREPPGQGSLQGIYRSDHHPHLICPLRFVCPEPLIAHDGIRLAYCPIAFFFPMTGLRICALAPSNPPVWTLANFEFSLMYDCSVPAYRHAYMHDRKRNEQRDSRGTAEVTYVSELAAEDIRIGIGTKYLSITTWSHKAMQDFYDANLSWIARLDLISGSSCILGNVITWAHKKRPFSALRDGPRHTLSINIYKMGIRQLQGPGGPCWRTLPKGYFRHSRRFLAESTKIETVGGNPAPNSRAVRVTSPDLFLCVSFIRLFCSLSSFFVQRRNDLCVADCIISPQPLRSFTFDFWSPLHLHSLSP